jgi:DNA-binding MarR family transcriptional regulator
MARLPADDGTQSAALDSTVVSRIRLGILRVARRIRQDADAGLTPSQQSTLVQLDRFGAMSLGELARRESVRPPSLTRTVQALETAGMVHREDQSGSRRVVVDLTDRGRLAAIEIHSRRDAWLTERMSALTDEELRALEAAAPVLERLLED